MKLSKVKRKNILIITCVFLLLITIISVFVINTKNLNYRNKAASTGTGKAVFFPVIDLDTSFKQRTLEVAYQSIMEKLSFSSSTIRIGDKFTTSGVASMTKNVNVNYSSLLPVPSISTNTQKPCITNGNSCTITWEEERGTTPKPTVLKQNRTIIPAALPPAPTNLKNTCTSDGTSCTVSWDSVSDATQYLLRVDNLKDGWSDNCVVHGSDLCKVLDTNSHTFTTTPGANYRWWVHATNSFGQGTLAQSAFTTQIGSPTPTTTITIAPTITQTEIPSATPTNTPTGVSSVTPTTDCTLREEGDANCDDSLDLLDFEQFRQEFIKFRQGTLDINTAKADFNNDKSVDIADFAIFRDGYLKYKTK